MKTATNLFPSPSQEPRVAEVLADRQWLREHLDDPRVRVVEVDVSPAAYNDGHIHGAVLWNIYADLKDADYRTAGAAAIQRLVTRSGIDPDSVVVFYGYAPAVGLWLMKLFGHQHARILNCSRSTWRDEGHPWATAADEPPAGTFLLHDEDPRIRADQAAVRDAIGRPGTTVVDVRSTAEYQGDCFWPSGGMEPGGRCGHVPSAVHQPVTDLYNPDGSFRSGAELREVFSPGLLDGGGELITYCTIGGRAATAWFVLTYLLGRDRVRVYDGSWAEWGRTSGTPVTSRLPSLSVSSAGEGHPLSGGEPMRTLHFGLRVADLDRSLAFYTAVGYEVVGRVPETPLGHLTMIKLPGDEFVAIELVHSPGHWPAQGEVGPETRLSHFVIKVESLNATLGELAAQGIDADTPVSPSGSDDFLTTWVTDPDGNRIELVQWPAGHADGMSAADWAE